MLWVLEHQGSEKGQRIPHVLYWFLNTVPKNHSEFPMFLSGPGSKDEKCQSLKQPWVLAFHTETGVVSLNVSELYPATCSKTYIAMAPLWNAITTSFCLLGYKGVSPSTKSHTIQMSCIPFK